jgi:hypothetical protein
MAIAPNTRSIVDVVKELEQEYGYTDNVPQGNQHITFTDRTGVVEDSHPPRLRLSMQVVCGPEKGRYISDYSSYFASLESNSEKSIEDRRITTKNIFLRKLGDLVKSVEDPSSLVDAWRAMPTTNIEADNQTIVDSEAAMADIASALEDQDVHVFVVVNERGTNVRYLKQGDHRATCTCMVSDRANPFASPKA